MDKKDQIILQQLDVIRSMTENNVRRTGSDFWGTPFQTVVMVVVIGVAHHLVARVVQGFDGLRVLLRPISHNKEGGLDTIPRQNVDKRLGILVAPR